MLIQLFKPSRIFLNSCLPSSLIHSLSKRNIWCSLTRKRNLQRSWYSLNNGKRQNPSTSYKKLIVVCLSTLPRIFNNLRYKHTGFVHNAGIIARSLYFKRVITLKVTFSTFVHNANLVFNFILSSRNLKSIYLPCPYFSLHI